jgi:hypothetical protein
MNKAETVASLERGENNGTRTTIVDPKLTRHKEFEKFAFTIDNDSVLESDIKEDYQPRNPKVNELTLDEINTILKGIFNNGEAYSYKNLQEKIKKVASTMFDSFGDNKCVELMKRLKNENFIIQREGSKNWCFNKYPL